MVLVFVLGASVSGAGCAGTDAGAEPDVVTAFYPLAYAAEQIGGHGLVVANLTPAGVEPHDVELSPRDVERVQAADRVFYVGAGFMPQLEEALQGGNNGVDVLAGVPTITGPNGVDPHVWLDPVRFADVARRIGLELGVPEQAERLAARLRELDGELGAGLARCERREIVTAHAAFGYLADRYGLRQMALAGLAPEAEPPARELQGLVDDVRRTGATAVFVEPLASTAVAETVAREAGVTTEVLDPIEGLGEEDLGRGADYFSVMRSNLRVLREVLGCR
jgi:zinc transport system substrate-binding protein